MEGIESDGQVLIIIITYRELATHYDERGCFGWYCMFGTVGVLGDGGGGAPLPATITQSSLWLCLTSHPPCERQDSPIERV